MCARPGESQDAPAGPPAADDADAAPDVPQPASIIPARSKLEATAIPRPWQTTRTREEDGEDIEGAGERWSGP